MPEPEEEIELRTSPKLTPMQQRFVEEYPVDLNATHAARRAGYSKKSASRLGCRLLDNADVAEAIRKALRERSKRTEITADKVVQQLGKVAFVNMKDVVKYGPEGVTILKSEDVDGTVLASVSETKEGIRVTLSDRMKALELLGRHLGMFTDKLEVGGTLTFEQQLRRLVHGGDGGEKRPPKT